MNPHRLFRFRCIPTVFAMSVAAAAQPGPAMTNIAINVAEVSETRNTGSLSQCTLDLTLTGDPIFDALSVRRVRVTKAVDNLDHDLVLRRPSETFAGRLGQTQPGSALKARLTLRSTTRSATAIRLIEGQIELFSPTEQNGGTVIISDILAHPAEPVQSAALQKAGIELMYLTKESYQAKKKELEQQAKNAAAENGALGKLGAGFADLFSGMFDRMIGDTKNGVALYIKDPDHQVVDLELQDANGVPLRTQSTFGSDTLRQISLMAPPPAGTRLLVYVASPDSVHSYPFKLENIALP